LASAGHAGYEASLARRVPVLFASGRARRGWAWASDRLERGRGVGELGDALANRREVGVGLRTARNGEVDGPRLIPVHPNRANRIVEQPALLSPAPCQRTAVVRHDLASSRVCDRTSGLYCGPRTLASERHRRSGRVGGDAPAPPPTKPDRSYPAGGGRGGIGGATPPRIQTPEYCHD